MKKNLKGMTLVEIIVALALFAIMGLMIASVFSATANLNKMTNLTNQKMDMQVALANIYSRTTEDKVTVPTSGIRFNMSGVPVDVDVQMVELEKNKPATGGAKDKVKTNIKYFTIK